jgi:hypothetical protein
MAGVKSILPSCGLYRTTKPLPEHEEQFPSGLLVYFHNHSDSGLPVVLAPDHNVQNQWHFHGAGTPFRGLSWADSLVKMPEQGFYALRKQLDFDGGSWPKGTLVQLGYTRNGDPILFIAQLRAARQENELWFSNTGVPLSRDRMSMLDALSVYVEPVAAGGHEPGIHTH